MRRVLTLTLLWIACSCSSTPEDAATDPRTRLGIPPEARTVVLFGQTAHLDVDWQKTFDDYYQTYVSDIFLEARQILEAQPRAFYSVAEMAYLKHHLEVHPEEAPALVAQARRGALRIVGGGVTSPDTLLPETELLLRDFLYGARFSEDTLGARAAAAWLPDSFGHAATVPDLLAAAGYSSVAFGRIDGAPTFFEMLLRPERNHLRPGSNAELLQMLGSADFIWRGPGGGHVLAHYFAYGLYCTGDNIDYDEPISPPGDHFGAFRGNDPGYTDHMIDSYVAALRPYARTPYLFVPVGCDFQHPKPQLIDYLDGYNQRHYADTGTFAVAATFADYAEMVSAYRDRLPELSADLTPYFMGFYGSRAAIKQRTRAAARPFFAAETFAAALGDPGRDLIAPAAPALELLTRTNHHDFITGTSTDAVVAGEQMPLLDQAEAAGQAALQRVVAALALRLARTPGAVGRLLVLNPAGGERSEVAEVEAPFSPPIRDTRLQAQAGAAPVPLEIISAVPAEGGYASIRMKLALSHVPALSWQVVDLFPNPPAMTRPVGVQLLDAMGRPSSGAAVVRVVLENEQIHAEWTRGQAPGGGFALTSLQLSGAEALAGPSFLLRDYTDMGGLWRLGHEMPGCSLAPVASPEPEADEVQVLDGSALGVRVAFRGRTAVREVSLDARGAGLGLALTTGAAAGTTRTVSFAFAVPEGAPLRTGLAGGFADRTLERLYSPTYWPAVDWLTSGPWVLLLRQSTGVRFGASGAVELLAARNAASEKCDAEGGTGTDDGIHRFEWRIERTAGPVTAAQAAQVFNRPLVLAPLGDGGLAPDLPAARALVQAEGEGVVSALKPAERGAGVVLRVLLLPGPLTLHLSPLAGLRVVQVDAAERGLRDLGRAGATFILDRQGLGQDPGSIATIRLVP